MLARIIGATLASVQPPGTPVYQVQGLKLQESRPLGRCAGITMIEGIHGHLLVIHRRGLSKSILLIDHLIPERRMNMGFRGRVVVVAAKRLLISTRHFLDNFATIKTSSVFVLLRRGFNRW